MRLIFLTSKSFKFIKLNVPKKSLIFWLIAVAYTQFCSDKKIPGFLIFQSILSQLLIQTVSTQHFKPCSWICLKQKFSSIVFGSIVLYCFLLVFTFSSSFSTTNNSRVEVPPLIIAFSVVSQ